MDNFAKINDCCGQDISHGIFGEIARRCIHELANVENYLAVGLTILLSSIIFILIRRLNQVT